MNIALIGYGKMGKVIEEIAESRGHTIVGKSNSQNPITCLNFSAVDVAIEFTTPHLAVKHIEYCIDKEVPIIVGTTAWNDEYQHVKNYVTMNNGAILHASNFSIGVNIFFDINRRLAKLMSNSPEYKTNIEETHHLEKIDAPSGTAVSLANDMILENKNYSSWIHQKNIKPNTLKKQIAVTSYREDGVPGKHKISYKSDIDVIEIIHTAKSRQGFALGAVIAAEWIANKKGIFTMQDVINI
jgi:4-hydroxy-tetrahydrodipicolinate reductase